MHSKETKTMNVIIADTNEILHVPNLPKKKNVQVHAFPLPLKVGHLCTTCGAEIINDETKTCEGWQWKVNDYLEQVPSYYYLEKTTIRIRGMEGNTVSSRISTFLRLNSFVTKYERTHVECDTPQFLTFIVQLWKGDHEDEIIVEAQRRNGCVLQMRRIRKSIHRAITSSRNEVLSQGARKLHEAQRCIHMITKNGSSPKNHIKQMKNACLIELSRAEQMIQSNYHDQKLLGMENIARIVSQSNEQSMVSSIVAESLVCGNERDMEFLRPTIGEYFYDTKIDENRKGVLYARGWNFGKLHFIALKVLKNALEVVFLLKRDGRKELSIDTRSWFWRNAMDALIYNAEVAPRRPLEASISISCLCLTFLLEPELQFHRLIKERLVPVIATAKQFGKAYHLNLETESQNLSNLFHVNA